MGEYHITIRAGRGLLVAMACLTFVIVLSCAGLFYLLVTYHPLDKLALRINLEQQYLKARMAASFPVTADINQLLRVPLNDTISVTIPFNQHFSIPFNKTLEVPIELNTTIPVYMTVPFKSNIPINTDVFVDTVINTKILGMPIAVPIKGYIPVSAVIPVDQQVVVHENFKLELRTPVSVDIKDTFQIPINTVFSANIPLKTELKIPFKEQILANVSLEGNKGEEIPNLYILDNTLDFKLDQMRLVWKDKAP